MYGHGCFASVVLHAKVQWICFGNVLEIIMISSLFGNTFEDLDDFKMYLHFVLVLGNPFLDPKL